MRPSVHIVKLCVGADSVEDLARWQASVIARRREEGLPAHAVHDTRMIPKRAAEVLAGGSLYWVIRGMILVRQTITGLSTLQDRSGRDYCEIALDPRLVPIVPTPRRAFQGWRYLSPQEAPPDQKAGRGGAGIPDALARELREAGVW